MKRVCLFWATFFALFGLLCLGVSLLLEDRAPAEDIAAKPGLSSIAQGAPSEPVPAVVHEEKGRIELVRPARIEEVQSPMILQPLFAATGDFKPGESAKLQFAVRDRATGLPAPGGVDVSASVKDGKGPALPLTVSEVEDGVFEVPFTPPGPGQFQITLSMNGVSIGSQKVGVVGVVGDPGAATDLVDLANVDRREMMPDFRPRGASRGRTR